MGAKKIILTTLLILFSLNLAKDLCYKSLVGVFNLPANEQQRTETKYIVIHEDDCYRESTIYEIEDLHRNDRHWSCGFAYNAYIYDGVLYQMHDWNSVNTATLSHNYDSVTICMHSADWNDKKSVALLILTIKLLKIKYPDAEVKLHCELNKTDCCKHVQNWFNEIKESWKM